MILPPFELHKPETLDEVVATVKSLRQSGEDFDYMAGGTDVLPNYKNRLNAKPHVVSLSALRELATISTESIGALANVEDLAHDPQIAEHFPALADAAGLISSPPLRNLGTVGGNLLLDTRCYYFNQSEFWRDSKGYCLKADGDVCLVVPQKEICYATYSGDLAPVFLALDAEFELLGPDGMRSVKMREFYEFDGIKRFKKSADEMLVRVNLPASARGLTTGYRKLRARDTIEYPVMGVAIAVRTTEDRIDELHVAVTGSEAIPLYYGDLGLNGAGASEDTAIKLQEALLDKVVCYRNVPFPPGYRKAMAGEFGRELFLELVRS